MNGKDFKGHPLKVLTFYTMACSAQIPLCAQIALQVAQRLVYVFYGSYGCPWAQNKEVQVIRYFIHLHRARPRLYRRRSLQVRIHISAFFEIYKMCILLHRSNLSNLAHFRHNIVDDFLALIKLGVLIKFAVF